jgi:hypothetical protein
MAGRYSDQIPSQGRGCQTLIEARLQILEDITAPSITRAQPQYQYTKSRTTAQSNWYAADVASALALCMVFITPSCSPNMDQWPSPQTEAVRPWMPQSSPDLRQQVRFQGKLPRCPRQQGQEKAEPGLSGPVWGHQQQTMLCHPGPVQHSLDQGKRGECVSSSPGQS